MTKRFISLVTAIIMLFSFNIVIPVQAENEQVNLITNGDFTDGFTDWTNAADGGMFDGTISENAEYIHGDGKAITNKDANSGGSGAGTLRRFIPIEGGKTYKLSFYAYNTGAQNKNFSYMSAFVPVVANEPVFGSFNGITFKDYVAYGGQNSWSEESQSEVKQARQDIIYSTGMNHLEYTINTPEDANYIMLSMFAWTSANTIYFSDFELYEAEALEPSPEPTDEPTTEPTDDPVPESGNLITNGDFTDGFTDWTNAADGGVFDGTISENAAYIHGDGKALTNKVGAGGNTATTLRRFVPVTAGKTYYLSFWVYNTSTTATGINECMSAFIPVKGTPVYGSFNGITFTDYVVYGGQNSWSDSKDGPNETSRTRQDIIYEPGMNHKEFLITVPTGAEYIMISMFAWTDPGRLYFSDFELYETDENTSAENKNIVKLNPADASPFNNGEFQGWGTSLCWWANRIGGSDEMTQQAADLFFSDDGLSLDIARFNIGGGDDPAHTHITRSDSKLPGYATGFDENGNLVYDWTADANQRKVTLAALEANPDLYVAGFSNSPPYFMTNSGCSSGAVSAGTNNLKNDQYENFAKYLADVTKHLKEADGIELQCLDPMNEPDTDYWGANSHKQEGCHFDAGESQSKMLIETRNALNNVGLEDVMVVGTDETSIDKAAANYNKLSEEAKAAMGRIDTHTYSGTQREQLHNTAVNAGKDLWMSEVDGNWDMFGLAERIITDVNGMQPAAWVIWNIVDRHQDSNSDAYIIGSSGTFYEKNMPFNPDGAIYGVALGNWDTGKIDLMQKYYGFGQFTRYIQPGMTIIGSSSSTLAAYDKNTGEIAIVALNKDSADKEITFDLKSFSRTGSIAQPIRTSSTFANGEQWAELETIPVENKEFTATLKARSITTYVIKDVNDAEVTEFTATNEGINYKFATSEAMSDYDKYFAVYDADGSLKAVTKNEDSGSLTGDFTDCTFRLMIWDDMNPVCNSITTVTEAEPIYYMIINGPTSIIAGTDAEYSYSVTLDSSDADPTITWTVSDTEIAEITPDGVLTAKKGGNFTITASTENGQSTTIDVTSIGLKL